MEWKLFLGMNSFTIQGDMENFFDFWRLSCTLFNSATVMANQYFFYQFMKEYKARNPRVLDSTVPTSAAATWL